MVFIEKKIKGNNEYLTFVKKSTFFNHKIRIKEHIGKNVNISAEEFYIKNFNLICKKESEIRKKISNELKVSYNPNIINDIEELGVKLKNKLELNNQNILNEFAKEFIFNSNNIEGSKIPAHVVKKLIETGISKHKNQNEVKEVFNSIDAFQYIRNSFKFNIVSIKRLYHILTKDLIMDNNEKYPRGFKKVEIVVGNSITTHPDNVEKEMKNLLIWYKQNKKKIHPLILAFDFHLKYEQIHPFRDGNGRTGRLILNKILIDNGYFPMIVYKDNKESYFRAIENYSVKPKKYYSFMLEQMRKTYKKFG